MNDQVAWLDSATLRQRAEDLIAQDDKQKLIHQNADEAVDSIVNWIDPELAARRLQELDAQIAHAEKWDGVERRHKPETAYLLIEKRMIQRSMAP